MPIAWTEEMKNRVSDMLGAGHSYSEIAVAVSTRKNPVSRSSIGGLVKRANMRTATQIIWTPAMDQTLRRMNEAGATRREICAAINSEAQPITLNMVTTRFQTLRLGSRADQRNFNLAQRIAAKAAKDAARAKASQNTSAAPKLSTAEAPVAAPTMKPVLFLEHKHGCRYPLWEDETPIEQKFYCGGDVADGRSYCVFHHNLCCGAGTPAERAALRDLKRLSARFG